MGRDPPIDSLVTLRGMVRTEDLLEKRSFKQFGSEDGRSVQAEQRTEIVQS